MRSLLPGPVTASEASLLRIAIQTRKSKLESLYLQVIRTEAQLKHALELNRNERNAYVNLLTKLHQCLSHNASDPTTKNPTTSDEALGEINSLAALRANVSASAMRVTNCYAELQYINLAATKQKHALDQLTRLGARFPFIGEVHTQSNTQLNS